MKSLRESWSDESGILGSKYFLSYIYTQKLTAVKFNMIRFNKFLAEHKPPYFAVKFWKKMSFVR